MSDELVYVWGPHSRVHVAVRHDGDLLSNERCQLDDVVGERTVTGDPDAIGDRERCRRCFAVAAGSVTTGTDVTWTPVGSSTAETSAS